MGRTALWLSLSLMAGCVLPRPIERSSEAASAREPAARSAAEATPAPAAARRGFTTFGFSREGRPLRVMRIGAGSRKVVWIGGIHGSEREGTVATRELVTAFAREPGLASQVTLVLIEDVNPDGSLAGTRGNARGVDLNRNFPANNFKASSRHGPRPLSEPESKALHDLLLAENPDVVIVAHSARRGRFINWDGPGEALAAKFADKSGFPMVPSDELHGTPGSLGSWWGRDRQQPILTLEYRNGEDPVGAWEATRTAILAVLWG